MKRPRGIRSTTRNASGSSPIIHTTGNIGGVRGKVLYTSTSCERITGYRAEEFAEDPGLLENLVLPEDSEKFCRHRLTVAEAVARGAATDPAQDARELVFRIQRRDGGIRWITHTCRAIFRADGSRHGLWATNRDITEHRQAEEALKEKFLTLNGIIESTDALIFSVDRDCRYTSFNRAHAAVMKAIYGAKIRLGGKLLDYMTVEADRIQAERNIDRCLGGESLFQESYSGEELRSRLYFDVAHTPIRDEEGRTIGVAVISRESTERKRAEVEIKSLKTELESRVEERTKRLEAMNRELESFSYSISHDLRAPLRAITGFSEILCRRYGDELDEEGRHYLANISHAGRRMDELILDLLHYSRLGRGGLHRHPVNIGSILADVVQDLHGRIAETGALVTLAVDFPSISGDDTLFTVIFSNLLNNALTYCKKNEPPRIAVSWKDGGDTILVSVSDEGIGIPPEYHAKIFEVFQRLHTVEEYPGTGVGLATVKKAAGLLGGSVRVESEMGAGSTFIMELPKE